MAPMRALRNLLTPPTSPSFRPHLNTRPSPSSVASDTASSILTDEITISIPESYFSDPSAPDPSSNPQAAAGDERTRTLSSGSADLRSADDLLTQFDVLRDSANAARARRTRFRGDGDEENGEPEAPSENEFMMRDRIVAVHENRPSGSPLSNSATLAPSDPSYFTSKVLARNVGDREDHPKAVHPGHSDVHYLSVDLGPDREYANSIGRTNALSAPVLGEKRCRRKSRRKLIGGPMALVRRILCLPSYDNEPTFVATHPITISVPIPREPSPGPSMSNTSTFENLLAFDTITTRRLAVRPRDSMVSPNIVDIR